MMWQYFDQQQQESSSTSTQQQTYKLMGGQDVVPETIPSYPASAMMPGAVSSGNVYGYPLGVASNIYDLSSQPEMTEEMKYPIYHNVRKHGNYVGNVVVGPDTLVVGGRESVDGSLPPIGPVSDTEVPLGMSNGNGDSLGGNLNINLNRRQYQGIPQHHRNHHNGSPLSSPDGVLLTRPGNSQAITDGIPLESPNVQQNTEAWAKYYGERVGSRNIADEAKYPASDPYEKRSGGGPGRMINRGTTFTGGHENQQTVAGPQLGYPENTYMEAVGDSRRDSGSHRLNDIDSSSLLARERHLMEKEVEQQQEYRQRQEEMRSQNDIWRGQTDGYYENNLGTGNNRFLNGRRKRHIGPHDGGIQRLISTGMLTISI